MNQVEMVSLKPWRATSLHLGAIALPWWSHYIVFYRSDHLWSLDITCGDQFSLMVMLGRHQWSMIVHWKWPIITFNSDHMFQSYSTHSHGKLKSSAPVSGKGLPKMDTGMASSTQIAVAASKAGSRLVRWQFGSDFDFDCSRDFFSCLARSFSSCSSRLILWASHLVRANS